MTYKMQFINAVKRLFAEETAAHLRREEVRNLVYEYVDILTEELYEVEEASNEKLYIEYEKITLNGTELGFDFKDRLIEVYTRKSKTEKIKTIDQLIDDGSTFISKNFGLKFDEALFDRYLQMVFADLLKAGQ